jgi:hypothetical protein
LSAAAAIALDRFESIEEARLELLAHVDVQLGHAHALLKAPSGARLNVDVLGARIEGPRIRASLLGLAAADWVTVAPDGKTGALDVRATLKTDDGAIIYSEYRGRVRFSPDGLNQVYTSPRFETGDERYAWLNAVQCVGKGISNQHERWLRYRLYAVF